MKLYYTGADAPNGIQRNRLLSVGGYVSSTVVPNDSNGAIFGAVSLLAKEKKQSEVICLSLYNDGADASSVSIWTENDPRDTQAEFYVGVQAILPDNDGVYEFDLMPDRKSVPVGVDMRLSSIDNKYVAHFPFKSKSHAALWIKRQVVASSKEYAERQAELKLMIDWR